MREASHWRKASALIAAAAGLAALVAACNTTSGVGKDISAAGGALSDTADKTNPGNDSK